MRSRRSGRCISAPPIRPIRGARVLVALGDSVTFGWGVAESETFLRLVEARLGALLPQEPVEVLNFGIPGYNLVMEEALLEARAREALAQQSGVEDFRRRVRHACTSRCSRRSVR